MWRKECGRGRGTYLASADVLRVEDVVVDDLEEASRFGDDGVDDECEGLLGEAWWACQLVCRKMVLGYTNLFLRDRGRWHTWRSSSDLLCRAPR